MWSIQIVGPTITSDTGLVIVCIPCCQQLVKYIAFLFLDYTSLKSWTFQLGHCVQSISSKHCPRIIYNPGAYSSHIERELERGLRYEFCSENCVSDCEDLRVFHLVSGSAWDQRFHVGECFSGVVLTSVNGSQALTLVISGTINGFMHVESVNLSVASYGFVTDENIVKLKDSYKSLINKPVGIYDLKELDLDKRFELSGHINQIQVATIGETWTSIHVLYCFEWKVPVSNSSLITFETWPASKLLYSQLRSTFKFFDIVAYGVYMNLV